MNLASTNAQTGCWVPQTDCRTLAPFYILDTAGPASDSIDILGGFHHTSESVRLVPAVICELEMAYFHPPSRTGQTALASWYVYHFSALSPWIKGFAMYDDMAG